VKWREVLIRDFEARRKTSIPKNKGWKVISEVSEVNLMWGEDWLSAVKGRELRRGGMWSVCKGSEVEWVWVLMKLELSTVSLTDCLVYRVVCNIDSSTSGSTLFWVWIVYKMCFWFCCNFAYWVLCVILCDVCYCIVLYCIVLYCIVLYYIVLIVLYLLYCTYCNVLYCIVLYCIVLYYPV